MNDAYSHVTPLGRCRPHYYVACIGHGLQIDVVVMVAYSVAFSFETHFKVLGAFGRTAEVLGVERAEASASGVVAAHILE